MKRHLARRVAMFLSVRLGCRWRLVGNERQGWSAYFDNDVILHSYEGFDRYCLRLVKWVKRGWKGKRRAIFYGEKTHA